MEEEQKFEQLTEEDKIDIRKNQSMNASKENEQGIQLVRERLLLNIKAKERLEDLLHGEISKEGFAFALAEDETLRQTIQKITEGMINPDPIESIKAERDPVGFDFVHGLSTFWDEMRLPLEEKVNVAVEAKEIADHIEVGMDLDQSPSVRRNVLKDLGIKSDRLNVLVTPADDARYQKEVEDHYRNEHMDRLGLKSSDVLDPADEVLINNLIEDSMAMPDGFLIDIARHDKEVQKQIDPYVEEYGMTAEELNNSFGYADEVTKYDYPAFGDLHQVEDYPTMKFAIEEYDRVYNGTLEDNLNELAEIDRIEAVVNSSHLSVDDLDRLVPPPAKSDQQAPPVLSEDDLRTLEAWDDFQL